MQEMQIFLILAINIKNRNFDKEELEIKSKHMFRVSRYSCHTFSEKEFLNETGNQLKEAKVEAFNNCYFIDQ